MFKLELRFQSFTIRDYTLRNGDVRFIGRSAENHIMLDDPHVSRRHARIARWGDELFVGEEVEQARHSSEWHASNLCQA